MHRALGLWLAILVCGWLPAGAHATQSVRLSATLVPERLGHGTTVGFDFSIAGSANQVPSPLTSVELSYPENLGFALSGLGLQTCTTQILEVTGAKGCPANSRMGYGLATAEVPGPVIVRESAEVSIVRAPTQDGKLALFFYVDAEAPVSAQLVFPGFLAPAVPPFGGQVIIGVPLVPSYPEASYVAVVRLRSTLGPLHLTYYEHAHGKTIAYSPRGVLLPRTCPHGGFRFAGVFSFLDGSTVNATATVPCPVARHGSGIRRGLKRRASGASARTPSAAHAATGQTGDRIVLPPIARR